MKKQKSIKGLKFSDRQNIIDAAISTGVVNDELANDLLTSNLQHDIIIDSSDPDADNADSDTIAHEENAEDDL